MNTANKITFLRLFLIPVFVVAYYTVGLDSPIPALVFVVASLTDWLDGTIARSRGLITTFGKFLDPLVDKLLTQAAFILLAESGYIPGWVVLLIVSRELMITGFRTVAASSGVTIAASQWGKYKTATQMLSIVCFLLRNVIPALFSTKPAIAEVLLGIAVVFTVISAVDYIAKNHQVLDLNNI